MALSPMQKRRRREWLLRATVAWENGMNGVTDVDLYAVNDNSPDVVADFASATEYFRVGGVETDFETMFGVPATTAYPTSLRTMVDSDGLLKWGPHNVCLQSDNLATNWVARANTTISDFQTLSTPSATGSNAYSAYGDAAFPYPATFTTGLKIGLHFYIESGTWDYGFLTFTDNPTSQVYVTLVVDASNGTFVEQKVGSTAGSVVSSSITASGSGYIVDAIITINGDSIINNIEVGFANASGNTYSNGGLVSNFSPAGGETIKFGKICVYRADLGGMVDNPDTGTPYVPTTTAARYLHRRGNHVYNGSSWVKKGILLETEARTNLLLNSGTLATQNVTTSATPYTLSFTGTGTVTLSGTSTAGPLVGTGTGENNRVNLTFTPTAGTLTLTVSGTVTNAQLEAGSTVSSHIPTAGATVTRTADALTIPAANMAYSATAMSFQMDGTFSFSDGNTATEFYPYYWFSGSTDYIRASLRTSGNNTFTAQIRETTASEVVSGTWNASGGINLSYNVAARHTADESNIALSGTAATAVSNPDSSLPILSATNFIFGQASSSSLNGNIGQFRQWDVDLGDSGIETAST